MNNIINYTLVLLLSMPLILFSQNTIPYFSELVKIDGKMEEPVWQQLTEITGFYNYMPIDEGLAQQQTKVKLFHNGEYLFISVVYEDTEARIQTSSLKRDVSIGLSDSFIFILDSQNQQQSAYYFAVNGYGTQVDGLVERVNEGFDFNTSWNAIWKTAASVNGTQKIYEIAIPLKVLNYDVNNSSFGIQMYVRDIKKNAWTIMTNLKRNYRLFDLRFTKQFAVENLPNKSPSRFAATPSLTINHLNDVANENENTSVKPSLDFQYNLSSSLKLDATINPDFSQVDVDQQVTNLTRFAIFFPERRNFFLENADLFSNLGVDGVNPFYSRKIGVNSDIQFGLKLSGNISPKTRIGVLNAQTSKEETISSQNYSAFVTEQQLSKNFSATGYLINRQQMEKFKVEDDYNRVAGANINFKSDDNKWIGLANYGKSFSNDISDKNNFYNAGIWFNTREIEWSAAIKNIGENYITDVGFTPRLYNYDAINDLVVREGYTQSTIGFEYKKFDIDSKYFNSIRFLRYTNDTYLDAEGKFNQSSHLLNSAIFFKNLSSVYYVFTYDDIDLKYGFDPLGNGKVLPADRYGFELLKVGYNSASNKKFFYQFNIQKGQYYNGNRTSFGTYLNYQLLPFANLEVSYDINAIDLKEFGKQTFHLARFTGEVFFNNRLNWTTYLQYNTQGNNFNVNSRLQWEYKPLSYVYLVLTNNYNQDIDLTDRGLAFKVNYRFDF